MTNAILICTLLIVINTSWAQRPDPHAYASKQVDWLKENLELTEDQLTQVKELHTLYADKTEEVVQSAGMPPSSAIRQKIEALQTEKESELKKILTEAQWLAIEEKFEEYQELGKPQRPQRPG